MKMFVQTIKMNIIQIYNMKLVIVNLIQIKIKYLKYHFAHTEVKTYKIRVKVKLK